MTNSRPFVVLVLVLVLGVEAGATDAFDPTAAAETWDDASSVAQDLEGLPVWDRVERLVDADTVLFRAEDFAPGWSWDDESPASPHIATAFGGSTPHSGTFLLHFAPGWALADAPHPVLLVPGAGASATGMMVPLARFLAAQGRSVFAVTFAHPHGDCYQQAEQVANAIARIQEVTGRGVVDIIGHSKGAIAAAIYLSNDGATDWGSGGDDRGALYASRGTPFRGDVRRFIAAGAPFGGADSAFRWTSTHMATGWGSDPLMPSAWQTFYPYTTASPLFFDDLRAVDLWPDEGDAFPGQAQLLRAWDGEHPLPGSDVALGVYALQQDWWTTYHGGLGFYSYSPGIQDAIDVAGGLLDKLQAAGVDPAVELAAVAGSNPLIWIDGREELVDVFGEALTSFLGQSSAFYATFLADVIAPRFPGFELSEDELFGVTHGYLVFGEISGQSDGVVFTGSALDLGGLLSRGANLLESRTADLGHMDLVFAGQEMGQYLVDQGNADPDGSAHLRALGERYQEEDTFSWYEEILAEGDDDDTGDDDTGDDDTSDDDTDDDSGAGEAGMEVDDDDPWGGGCACLHGAGGRSPLAGAAILGVLAAVTRRRRG